MKKVILYTEAPDADYNVPLLSFNLIDMDSNTVADILSNKYNIAVRSGLHCAPLAHKKHHTTDIGTVRVVPSVFTKKEEIDRLVFAVSNI